MTPKEFVEKQWVKHGQPVNNNGIGVFSEDEVIEMLTEYAKLMCEEQKEICAESALVEWGEGIDYDIKVVSKSSIILSRLPDDLTNWNDI